MVVYGATTVLVGSVFGVGANGYVVAKTKNDLFSKIENVPSRKVAIVLGAKVYQDGAPSVVLRDRLLAAKELYDARKVQQIIVSGDHKAKEYDEPKAMYRFLVAQGIPPKDIFLDHAGLRTFDTMARAAAVFGVASAVICTQKFHLNRSVFLAQHHGIDAVGFMADRRTYRHHGVNLAREFVARSAAVLDTTILQTQPRHMGSPISMNADGRITHDDSTGK